MNFKSPMPSALSYYGGLRWHIVHSRCPQRTFEHQKSTDLHLTAKSKRNEDDDDADDDDDDHDDDHDNRDDHDDDGSYSFLAFVS